MSAAETGSLTSTIATCIQCGASNSLDAKFCAACGSSLWDQCPSCNTPSRRGQKFCGSCGFHLQADFEKRLTAAKELLNRAEELLADCQFDEARGLAARLINREEPRMNEISIRAEEIASRAKQLKDEWTGLLDRVQDPARQAAASRDFGKVVELLAPIPESILGEGLTALLAACRKQLEEYDTLQVRFQHAVEANDYLVCGVLIDQLVSMRPDYEEHRKWAKKIGKALAKSAQKRFSSGLYADALARLDAIPSVARDNTEYTELRKTIDNVSWLTDQVARSPYATPVLGRLVQKLTKLAPHDVRAPKLLQQLAVKVKSGSSDPLSLFGPWVGNSSGWQGAQVSVMSWPRRINFSDVPLLRQHPTRFVLAFGLALQGLGLSAFPGSLQIQAEKAGFFKLLGKRKEIDAAWGIDAGASALRAVKLVREGDKLRVADAVWLPYEQPLCRTSIELKAPVLQRERLDELAPRLAEDDIPIWAGLPSRESLGRFLVLPPVGEKQLAKLIEQEIEAQFPLASDQLVSAHSITGKGADGSPRAVLLAAKKFSVEQREKAFTEAGIKLTGLQAEPIALHNYARYEFQEYFESDDQVNATPDGICIVDAGASGITLYAAHRDAFWFRFTEGGGEDLTSKLASAITMTQRDAEPYKLNPGELDQLALGMEAMEARIDQTGARLYQHYQQAAQFLGELKLRRILCTGGVPLMHGWIRHTFMSATDR